MALPLFHVGQRVSVSASGRDALPGVFRIVSAVPAEGSPQRYRIKSDTEPFERIVDESRLEDKPF